MPVRMTGMISGLDTESLIKGMVDAQKLKNKRVEDKSVLLEWKQDRWKELNAKIYKLYTDNVSKMRLQGNYQTKKVTSTNDSLVSVTGSTNAPNGALSLTVDKLASAQFITGDTVVREGKVITGNSKLVSDLGMTDGTLINIKTKSGNKTIDVNSNTTINSFLDECKKLGLNASYDTNQKRIFISSKQSGGDNDFSITTSTDVGTTDRRALDGAVGYANLSATDKVKIDNAYESIKGADSTKLNTALASTKIDESDDEETKKLKNAVAVINSFSKTNYLNDSKIIATNIIKDEITNAIKTGLTSSYTKVDYKDIASQDEEVAKEELRDKYDNPDLDFNDENIKKELDSLVAKKLDARVATDMSTDQIKTEITNLQQKIFDSGYTANYSDGTTTTYKSFNDIWTGIKTNITKYSSSIPSAITGELSKIGLCEITELDGKVTVSDSSKVKLVEASDCEITLNGAKLTNSSNVIQANGLTITAKGQSASETITLNVTDNSQNTYDMVKNFIKSYNDVLKEMNSLYYAETSKGYAPLSDDEKEAMTDDQIKKWETKIQDSILRRDSTLGTVISSMRSSLMTSVVVNGKTYSLSSYGIETSTDYTEKGLLHIHGDAEDSVYSDKADKLMKAIQEDPETVMDVLSGITKKLYDAMDKNMKPIINVRSAFTVYNDKLMDKQQTEYKKKVALLEDKLVDMENKYYKQFAAMEKALANLQSQSNALLGMLGMSNQK